MSAESETHGAAGSAPDVKMNVAPDAAEFIRRRGGTLYVWTDKAGMMRSRTKAPSANILARWIDLQAHGVRVRLAPDLAYVPRWRIDLRTFPWKRVEITSSTMLQFDSGPDYLSLIQL